MSDPIGTVRREMHGKDGFSVWVKVGVVDANDALYGAWQCVYSTAIGNIGETLKNELVEQDEHTIVTLLPYTPAANPSRTLLDSADDVIASMQELRTDEPGEFNRGWNAAVAATSVVVRRESGGAR